ncbi:MAG: lipopolysaccharide biosynthesis protein [Bacteroidota bacterium]
MAVQPKSFARSVLALASGGVAAQAVVFLARPVLTRLYSPEAFGVLGIFVALASVLAVLATLRYEDAVVLPERDVDGRALLALTWGAALAVSGLAALALLPREAIAQGLGVPGLAPLLPWVALVGLLYAYGNGAQAWLGREHAFRLIAVGIAAQSVTTVAVQLLARGIGSAGLVVGVAAGAVAFALVLVVPVLGRGVLRGLDPAEVARVARRYERFPRLGLPATALGQVGSRVPPLALGAAFGAATVGHFALAAMAVVVPLAFGADAVGQVYGVHAAEAQREARLATLTRETFRRLVGWILYPVAAAALVGPVLFALVFGTEWETAGLYARLLAPWLALSVLVPPLTRAFDATERQDRELWGGALHAVGVVGGLGAGALLGTPEAGVLALGLGGALGRLGQLLLALSVAGVSPRAALRDAARPLGRTAMCLLPAVGLTAASGEGLPALVAAVAGGVVCWGWTWRAERGFSPAAASTGSSGR